MAQLQEREASVTKLQTTASELLAKCRPESGGDVAELTDSLVMQEQLAGLNAQWTKVQLKAKARTENLKVARKNVSCQKIFIEENEHLSASDLFNIGGGVPEVMSRCF